MSNEPLFEFSEQNPRHTKSALNHSATAIYPKFSPARIKYSTTDRPFYRKNLSLAAKKTLTLP